MECATNLSIASKNGYWTIVVILWRKVLFVDQGAYGKVHYGNIYWRQRGHVRASNVLVKRSTDCDQRGNDDRRTDQGVPKYSDDYNDDQHRS